MENVCLFNVSSLFRSRRNVVDTIYDVFGYVGMFAPYKFFNVESVFCWAVCMINSQVTVVLCELACWRAEGELGRLVNLCRWNFWMLSCTYEWWKRQSIGYLHPHCFMCVVVVYTMRNWRSVSSLDGCVMSLSVLVVPLPTVKTLHHSGSKLENNPTFAEIYVVS